jgi:tetratricopeptide (TPR) repeat protein/transcriptional regulator with XRE-family HTH domain
MHIPETDPQPRLRLTEARINRGWSQREVARRINTTYVNISRWERGITRPTPYFRRKLCQLFGKSEQELGLEATADVTITTLPASSPSPPPPSHNAIYDPSLPLLPAVRLVGRDNELAHIRGRLCVGGNVALTALNGLPGVGKTALSIALAHDQKIREHFRDGILWAGLGPHPNRAGLLHHWGALLGVEASEMAMLNTSEAWARALRNAIGLRPILIIIDDAWQLEDALIFKVGGPNCAHLVTTRFPTIATTISDGGTTVIHELGEEESMTLLKQLAPEAVDQEAKRTHDLVHAVGGLPLALRLMGNYLRKVAYSGQPRRVYTALQRLSDVEERLQIGEPQGPVESHPSLSANTPLSLLSVFAVTDQQLDEQARAALYALATFPAKPHSFSEEAALTGANCSVETIDALIDAGLLESSGPGRYMLHQTIADYGRTHLQDATVYDRLIAYASRYVKMHKKDYELLEQESSVILAVLEMAYELGRQAELVRSVIAFAPFLLLRGFYDLAEQHLQRAHRAAMVLEDLPDIANVLLYLGEIAQKQGHFAQAGASYQEGLALARRLGDPERIGALLTNLGWVTLKRGKYTEAESYLQEGLTLARQIGDPEQISNILKILGPVVGSRGDYARSEAYLQEGLTLARQLGDREQICALLISLGATAGQQGNYTQAEAYFQEGLALARQIGHREWISALLTNLGEAADEKGNHVQAELYFQEGLTLARQLGHREWISILLTSLGSTMRKQGHHTQAEAYLRESLTLAKQLGRPEINSTTLYEYGILYLDQQKLEAAEAIFREMLNTTPEGDQDLSALAHYGLARIAATQGNVDEARQRGEVSVAVLETMGHHKAKEVRDWLDSITA